MTGCQSDSYGNSKNPYLLRPHQDLPPVSTNPKTPAPEVDTTAANQEPVAEETQGLSNLEVEEVETDVIEVEEPAPVVEEPIEAPAEDRYYVVVRGDSIWKVATKFGVSQKELIEANDLDVKEPLLVGQKLKLPAGALAEADSGLVKEAQNKRKKSSGTASTGPSAGGTYTVKRGDNLWTIPKRFGVNQTEFLDANGLSKNSVIHVGQKVVIPGKSGNLDSSSSSSSSSASSSTSSTAVASGDTYTVQKGDNLWTIPKKLRVTRKDFMAVNGFDQGTVLQIGQTVKIPGKGDSPIVSAEPQQSFVEESAVVIETTEPAQSPDAIADELTNSNDESPLDATITKEVMETPETNVETAPAEKNHNTYTLEVNDGDTLDQIALIYSTTIEEIKQYNPSVKSTEDLKPGMTLTIPFKD